MVHHILKRKIIGSMEVQPVTQWTGIQLRAKHLLLNFFADTVELNIQHVANGQDLLRKHKIPFPQIPAVGQHGNTHKLIPPIVIPRSIPFASPCGQGSLISPELLSPPHLLCWASVGTTSSCGSWICVCPNRSPSV